VREWLGRFGAGFTESLLESNNQIPDFIVRVNALKTNKDSLMEAFRNEGLTVGEGRYAREAVIIKNPGSVTKLKEFKNGFFQVQDESSMLVAHVLDPQPGELVMDVCSAPGGKTTHIAELMMNKGTVIARDIHEHKIAIIEENIRRLGINIVKTEIFNAAEIDDAYTDRADRVLVDAPCTGLGIIRRKPDIKWARNIGDRKEIVRLQTGILHAASRYVKPGGVLVYSTCTIEPEENQDVVREFLKSDTGFRMTGISSLLPAELKQESTAKGYVQLYPNIHGTDGFFIARMKRTG
jgi:16S rRNA (cytosine967-C5)-methyltransferase